MLLPVQATKERELGPVRLALQSPDVVFSRRADDAADKKEQECLVWRVAVKGEASDELWRRPYVGVEPPVVTVRVLALDAVE